MNTFYQKVIGCVIMAFIGAVILNAQQIEDYDHGDVIIIEKTIDENGNEVSKRITRKNKSDFSEKELQNMIDSDDFGNQMFGRFDLEGLGFDADIFSQFGSAFGQNSANSKPTLGVSINTEGNKVIVKQVTNNSGAYEADIRMEDQIITVNDEIVATVEDIADILKTKKVGDKVKVLIYRDGEEIEKEVELRNNSFGFMGLSGGNRGFGNNFFFDGQNLNIDSILQQFRGQDFGNLFEMPNGRNPFSPNEDIKKKEEKPSLGIFIEDDKSGVLVTDVIKGSAADLAGMLSGDVILRVDDEIVTSYRELSMLLNRKSIGDSIDIQFERGKKIKEMKVELK